MFHKKGLKELRRASRRLSRKVNGSNNRRKARLSLARVHKRIANRRRHYHFDLAGTLARTYDYLFFEDLNLKGMQRLWGRKVSDLGFAQFLNILKHQAEKNGCVVSHIDKWFPSSKLCSSCGVINESLTLKERTWQCVCGITHKRDLNAALNILREGTSSLGLGDVRPALQAISA